MTTFEISIHALCEEGDITWGYRQKYARTFLSTPSARRATVAFCHFIIPLGISIHALCEEGDALPPLRDIFDELFLSTPSARRATRRSCEDIAAEILFLSTPSARRATVFRDSSTITKKISIHALCEEGDLS